MHPHQTSPWSSLKWSRGIATNPQALVGDVVKIGRNSPCPCGSGKKYKKCCMPRAGGLDAEKLALYRSKLSRSLGKERHRREKYGYVRPVISTTFDGLRWVAVGSTVYYSKAWKTVPDFLFYYIKVVLGAEWGTNEIKTKPLEERHPILQLYHSHCLFQERHQGTKNADGLYHGELDGPAAAYLQLAYDLYVLGDHLELQESLVTRLKHPDQFQGARYELAVATHCIRAGFDIAFEDETDTARKHPEFIATHRETGQLVAVEAKSRHRPGVFGFPGEKQEEPRAGVRNILLKALDKFDGLPYAVFVDLNLPPHEVGDITELPWLQELIEEIQRLSGNNDEPHHYNLLMFTNYPEHYGAAGATKPGAGWLSAFSRNPRAPIEHPEALKALYDAAHQYGRVPTWFEDEPLAG